MLVTDVKTNNNNKKKNIDILCLRMKILTSYDSNLKLLSSCKCVIVTKNSRTQLVPECFVNITQCQYQKYNIISSIRLS